MKQCGCCGSIRLHISITFSKLDADKWIALKYYFCEDCHAQTEITS